MSASGFFYTVRAHRATTKAEQALLDAAFPWVITNKLPKETQLNNQSHRSKTAFLICKGQLTFERLKNAWPGNKVQHVRDHASSRVAKRYITASANSMYSIRARRTEATYVEGQVCLSPELALRLVNRGLVRYYLGDEGNRVSKKILNPLLEKIQFEGVKGSYVITVPGAKTDPIARSLQDWFRAEWFDYQKKVKAQKDKRILCNENRGESTDQAMRMDTTEDGESNEFHSDSASSETGDGGDIIKDEEDEEYEDWRTQHKARLRLTSNGRRRTTKIP